MNIALNPTQSDTRKGDITLIAAVNLTGLEGYACVIVNTGGVAQAALPATQQDLALFIVASGDIAGNEVHIESPAQNENCRIRAYGSGNPGAPVVLANPTANGGAQAGMVTALPATPGSYFSPGVAEEAFVDGQLVKIRPQPRLIRVASADSLTALTFSSGGATGAEVGALRAAVHACLQAQGLMA